MAKEKAPKKTYNLTSEPASKVGQVTPEMEEADRNSKAGALALVGEMDPAVSAALGRVRMKKRNSPNLTKPGDMPLNETVVGILTDVVRSPGATVRGVLLVFWSPVTKREWALPCSGTIRQALVPGVKMAETDSGEVVYNKLHPLLIKEAGRIFSITRRDSKKDKKYQKDMFIFDVETSDEVFDLEILREENRLVLMGKSK